MKRIFLASEILPGKKFDKVFSMLRDLTENERIKWVEYNNIHITLAFIGDTNTDRIKAIVRMLKDKCEGSGEFDFNLRGLGVFKNLKDPRVIWAGIEHSDKLDKLHNLIRTGLAECSLPVEERAFKPHLTLGRIRELKNPGTLQEFIENFRDTEIQKVHVSEIILFESVLLPSGPLYKPLNKISLSDSLPG
jgi:2'-5' RNA ligase